MTAAAALAAGDSTQFYEQLVGDLTARREALSEAEKSFGGFAPLGREELIEWLQFQCWYEREAAGFIGSWLRDTPEDEVFVGLCRQVADEGKHFKLLHSHLQSLGASMEGWKPEPEWDARITTRVVCDRWFGVRDQALLAHATQIDPDGFWFAIPRELQAEVWPTEDYELVTSHVEAPTPEDDLFAGLLDHPDAAGGRI